MFSKSQVLRVPELGAAGSPEFVVRRVIEGGMGICACAQNRSTGALIALKALRPELASTGNAGERFAEEGRTTMLISTPGLLLRWLPLLALVVVGCNGDDDTLPPMRTEDDSPMPPRGHAWVVINTDTVIAEVADTPESRRRGLMFRTELEGGRGMIFVFEEEGPQGFWMRDTYIPLDIAYLDRSQRIVDIQHMEPHTEDSYESEYPALFALEVPQGWFEAQGIRVGDQARIIFGRR
jgi:uncharacterized protein